MSAPSSSSVKVLSRRKLAGEGDRYRPGAQQRQVDLDDFFEFRYDACLRCKDFVMDVYHRILLESSRSVLESIKNDVTTAAASTGGINLL